MDITTLSLAKKYANKVAAGFSKVEVQRNNLIFTLNDGTKATMTIPTPEKGSDGISIVDVSIDTDGSLLCHMSDGSTINAGKIPTVDQNAGNVSSDTINSIVVVDSLPVIEEDGVLYLVKGPMEYVANPPMMMGYISSTDGTQSESTDHYVSGYIYINGKPKLTITNSAGLSMEVLCYDKNKNFMTGWSEDSSGTPRNYKQLSSGSTFEFPYDAYYIRLMISSTQVVDLTIAYDERDI